MRCETSFFSWTLFKKHLQRYWPLWGVWLAGWTLAMPVELWNESRYRSVGTSLAAARSYPDTIGAASILLAIVAPLVAVAVFFHLFKTPAANFVGALPLRREGVFATAFAAGYVMLVAPLVVVSLLTLAVEAAVGALAPGELFTWLLWAALLAFFWFSFAVLCCVISGSAVAGVSFYVIFNGVVMGMVWLVQTVLQVFLYGFDQFTDGVWEVAMWLTPIANSNLSDEALRAGAMGVDRGEMVVVYAAVGFLFLLAALGLHHIRKAERAGDLIAFGPIRWVFRISVTLCGGLAFGILLMSILFQGVNEGSEGAPLAGCCAVAAMVSWFAAEMLLQKSFKVFKGHWKGAVIGALCFVLAICAIDMDWIGFTTRIPQPEQVKTATAVFGGSEVDLIAAEGLVYDEENVVDLIALHQYLVDHKSESGPNGNWDYYCRLELTYDVGLTQLHRDYSYYYKEGDALDSLTTAAQREGQPYIPLDRGNPARGWVFVSDPTGDWDYGLSPAEAQTAWEAVQADVLAGRYRAGVAERGTDLSYVELSWVNAMGNWEYSSFYFQKGATEMNAFLEGIRAETGGQPRDLVIQTDQTE